MNPIDSPWDHDRPGARALATAYRDYYEEISTTLTAWMAQHAVFGPLIAAIPTAIREQQSRDARVRIELAFSGNWSAYVQPLRAQGAQYAAAGLRFADWYNITGAWQRIMIPKLIARHASDPVLLAEVLQALQELADKAMAILAHAYIDASAAQLAARAKDLERWEAIFSHVAWGVIVVDVDGVIELANPAFALLCALTQPAAGMRFQDLFVEGELERVRSVVGDTARREGRVAYEAELRRGDGTTFPARVEVARIPAGAENTIRWALNITDLTEKRRTEALHKRSADLEEENKRIQAASRLKSEFLANMSHELRTPLNSIIGFGELLHMGQVGPLEEKQHEFIGDILSSGKHLLRLINDVLDLSKVESGTMQFRPEPIDTQRVADEVTSVLRSIAAEKQIRIEVSLDPAVRELWLDPARLKQILYNFLSNALKFSPHGGLVSLTIAADGPISVRVSVKDRGTGIPVEDQHRLFVEFEQLDGGRNKAHAGTGLGLALTRRLVEAQGGTVGVESAKGEGATFHAVLPRRAPSISLPKPRRIAGASTRAPRILVVEDDANDQDRLVSTLLAAGFAVDTASTGAQAKQICETRAYDAITLDLLLPDCTGLEVLSAIRGTSRHQRVPVIVVSRVSEQVTSGFVVHDALPKPIDETSLLASLSRAGLTPPGEGPVLVVDDDESSAKLMMATLAQLGFAGVVARDGAEALALAEQSRPSAVVLDLVMPTLDGFGFLERFRRRAEFARIPVLVWTMRDLSIEEQTDLLRNAQAVMVKDGSGAQSLVDTVRAHLRPLPIESVGSEATP